MSASQPPAPRPGPPPAIPARGPAAPGAGAPAPAAAGEPLADLDAAVAGLRRLDGAPVETHAPAYEDVHRRLQEALATLDAV